MLDPRAELRSNLVARVEGTERRCVKGFKANDKNPFTFMLSEGYGVLLSKVKGLVRRNSSEPASTMKDFTWNETVNLKPSNGAKKDNYVTLNEENFEDAITARHDNLMKSKDASVGFEFIIYMTEKPKEHPGISRSSAKKRQQSVVELGTDLLC